MTIKQFLQTGQYTRLSCPGNDRWMFWHYDRWTVVERKRYARTTVTLLVTEDEHKAIAKLIEGEEDNFDKSLL